MMARSHILVGIALTTVAGAAGIEPVTLPVVAAAVAGSLAPDIDTPYSALGRSLPFLAWPIYRLVGHRTLTHSLLILPAIAGVAMLASSAAIGDTAAGLSFLIGYAGHILADMPCGGCQLYYPLDRRRFAWWPNVRTGGFGEAMVLLMSLAILFALAVCFDPHPAFVQKIQSAFRSH